MTLPPLAAGVGIEGIIWIIILIFWSVAQFVQKNRAAQRRPPARPGLPPPPPTRQPTQMENELQDLLRELTGQAPLEQDDEPELESPPARPEPPPVIQRSPPPPPSRPPQTLASARKFAQAEVSPPSPRRPIAPATIRDIPEYIAAVGDLSEGMGAAFQNSGKMPGLTLNMRNVSLRGISYTGNASPGRKHQSAFDLAQLRNPATLRQMFVGRLILDKPKALDSSPGI